MIFYMFRRKKRDVDDNSVETVYPFLNKISQIGWDNLKTVNCQKVTTRKYIFSNDKYRVHQKTCRGQ